MAEEDNSPKWIGQLHEGKEEAWRVFFDEYYGLMCVFAMKYVKEKEAVEDIVQDVVTELYSRRLRFKHPKALRSWLYLTVRNRALNLLRRQQAEKHNQHLPEEEENFFLNNMIREEVYYMLNKTIGELSDSVRQIYELTLQELSNEEIAQQLGLSVDSVKSHKKRGKQILKEKLKDLLAFSALRLMLQNRKIRLIPQA